VAAFTIARLANSAGVGVETVRFYQRRGLLRVPDRPVSGATGGGVRRYDDEDLKRLRFIRSAQAAGFTLAQIASLLDLDRTADRGAIRELAGSRIKALDRQIRDLTAARSALARLAKECGSGSDGPCPIVEAFDRGH
jgi:MerR family transcriptional regulator, mercuric resistance operon regulatory protein